MTTYAPGARVWIVIVNYRTAGLAADCLRSLEAEYVSFPYFNAVVVDNASGDGSVEKLQAAIEANQWQSWASMLPSDRNGGFAYGNNVGIKHALSARAHPEYVMLLNPDTIVRPGALRALVDFMDKHQRSGIAGSLLENADGRTDCSAHNAFTPLGELVAGANLGLLTRALDRYAVSPPVRSTAHRCDWVSGASLMVRAKVFVEIGMMDDHYFLYFEEADFCLRARQAGWEIWFVPDSRVVHLEGAATGIRDVVRRRPRYWYESRRRYFIKHFGVNGLLRADALWAIGRTSLALRRLLRLGRGGAGQDPKWYALDLLWGDLRSVFNGRTWQIR